MTNDHMRILHLVHVRWWNASAQYAIHLAAAQQDAGHEVTVVTDDAEPAAEHARNLGLTVTGLSLGGIGQLGLAARLRAIAQKADVVNAHHADMQNIALAVLRGRAEKPIVRTRVDVRDAKPSFVNRRLYNKSLASVIVPGENSRRRYIELLGVSPDKVATVYGGVDHERFRPHPERRLRERSRLGIGEDTVAFGLVGRLGAIKAPEVFLEAAAETHRRHPKSVFLLAGRAASGHSEEEYRGAAERLGIPDARFLGFVADVPALMNALDCGVITSVGSEAHCRVGLEMMSSGLPVVGTDIGVIPEVVINGQTGYIVRSRDARDLALAMGRLLSDSQVRDRLGRQARSHIEERFTFAEWVRRTDAVYRQAMRTT